MNTQTTLAIVLFSLCLSLSCNGDDPKQPEPINPDGDWAMQYTVVSDTCGAGFIDEIIDVQLRLSPDRSFLIWQDEGRPCDNSTGHRWDESGVGSATEAEEFQGSDGCTYHDQIDISVVFTSDTYNSDLTHTRTVVAGSNCTDFPVPCQIVERVVGARCSGCYGGCT